MSSLLNILPFYTGAQQVSLVFGKSLSGPQIWSTFRQEIERSRPILSRHCCIVYIIYLYIVRWVVTLHIILVYIRTHWA